MRRAEGEIGTRRERRTTSPIFPAPPALALEKRPAWAWGLTISRRPPFPAISLVKGGEIGGRRSWAVWKLLIGLASGCDLAKKPYRHGFWMALDRSPAPAKSLLAFLMFDAKLVKIGHKKVCVENGIVRSLKHLRPPQPTVLVALLSAQSSWLGTSLGILLPTQRPRPYAAAAVGHKDAVARYEICLHLKARNAMHAKLSESISRRPLGTKQIPRVTKAHDVERNGRMIFTCCPI